MLDASAFPHIVDSIFAYADAHDLVRLRTGNRAWRDRADALLSAHIVHFRLGSVYALVRGDLIRHPAFHKTDAKCPRGPTMDALRVVDAVDGETWEASPPYLRMWETDHVRHHRGVVRLRAHTAVVFAWAPTPYVDPGPCLREFWEWAEKSDTNGHDTGGNTDRWSQPTGVLRPLTLNSGTRKLVINFSPESNWSYSDREWIVAATGPRRFEANAVTISKTTLREVVINFVLPPGEHVEAPLVPRINSLLDGINLFGGIGRIYGADYTHVKYTIVNSAAVSTALLYDVHQFCTLVPLSRHEVSFENCAEALFDDSVQRWGRRPAVEYISSEEYEARVGTERYRIETMEQPR
jgi:hypothetical protein